MKRTESDLERPRYFPTERASVAMIWSGEELQEDLDGIELHFMTPPIEHDGGIPTVTIREYKGGRYSGDRNPIRHALSQRSIAELRDWCERTLFVLANPDRYDEETSWKKWFQFTTPQRVGFARDAFESCDVCFDEEMKKASAVECK